MNEISSHCVIQFLVSFFFVRWLPTVEEYTRIVCPSPGLDDDVDDVDGGGFKDKANIDALFSVSFRRWKTRRNRFELIASLFYLVPG